MPVTNRQLAMLRAHLTGDYDECDRLRAEASRDDLATFAVLQYVGFTWAVLGRFADDAPLAAVIEYVGEVRARSDWHAERIDPIVAERLIRRALGHGDTSDLDADTTIRARLPLLAALVADEQYDEPGLDAFLAKIRELADEFIERRELEQRDAS